MDTKSALGDVASKAIPVIRATLGCCDAIADCGDDTAVAAPLKGGGGAFPAVGGTTHDLAASFYRMKDQLLVSATSTSASDTERQTILARAQKMKAALVDKYGPASRGTVSTAVTSTDTTTATVAPEGYAEGAHTTADGGATISTAMPPAAEPRKRSQQRMTRDDFEELAVVGRGSFGVVRLVRGRGDGELYALKAMGKDSMIKKNQVSRARASGGVIDIHYHMCMCVHRCRWTTCARSATC